MGIFGADMNLAEAPQDPRVPDGDYLAEIVDLDFREYRINSPEHEGKTGRRFLITYEVIQGPATGLCVPESFWCNPWDSDTRKAYLNRR
ncbi:MAG: hypothetical protein JWR37_3632, partial [Mycobacterium sp.]|nr:hypothetical protein [Mycobacterium sp.]